MAALMMVYSKINKNACASIIYCTSVHVSEPHSLYVVDVHARVQNSHLITFVFFPLFSLTKASYIGIVHLKKNKCSLKFFELVFMSHDHLASNACPLLACA